MCPELMNRMTFDLYICHAVRVRLDTVKVKFICQTSRLREKKCFLAADARNEVTVMHLYPDSPEGSIQLAR